MDEAAKAELIAEEAFRMLERGVLDEAIEERILNGFHDDAVLERVREILGKMLSSRLN